MIRLFKNRKKQKFLHPVLMVMLFLTFTASAWGNSSERLIVFTNTSDSPVNRHFRFNILPEIRSLASEMGVAFSEERLERGAPEEIGTTPLIVYQNALGRSIYQGRSNTLSRIKNFIRTSRRIPQGDERIPLKETPVWRTERAAVWAPLKISDLGGTRPRSYDPVKFQKESIKAILSGFSSFSMVEKAWMNRCDRGFYMDFYPWRAEDGTLFISLALFSQFHCKKPVFELREKNIRGSYENREGLFRRAGERMEQEVKRCITDPYSGDGFDVVSRSTPLSNWKDLGYPLPESEERTVKAIPAHMSLPSSFSIRQNDSFDPMIQFRFPPPLDNYSGEFTTVRGELQFPTGLPFSGMKGHVAAITDSVTMGEPDLDRTLKGGLFLNQKKHPRSDFTLNTAQSRDPSLRLGKMSIVDITETFQLKGKTVPLSLPVEIEAVLDDNDRPLLLVRGSFSVDLRVFSIEGATGPEPQKNTLIIDLNLAFSPESPGT